MVCMREILAPELRLKLSAPAVEPLHHFYVIQQWQPLHINTYGDRHAGIALSGMDTHLDQDLNSEHWV